MSKVVLLTVSYKGYPLEIVKNLLPSGFSLITLDSSSHEELVVKAEQADYILASGNLKIEQEVLASAKNLKMIQRLGVGMDSLDFHALKDRNIPVYVNPGINSNSVAEHSVLLILACLRRLPLISNNTKNGVWNKQEQSVTTRELAKQTVGIIGMGNIGRRTAELLKPFGCRMLYYSVDRPTQREEELLNIEYRSLDEVLESSDIISLHCPLTDSTRDIIRKETIKKMKDGVIIVNTSRGKLINEDDLLMALETGKIGFAGLDVYREEPLTDLTLVKHEHVICTPHIAGNSYDAFSSMMEHAFRNIQAFDEGREQDIEPFKIKMEEYL